MPVVEFKKLHPDVDVPPYATVGSAGCDLVVHNFKEIRGEGATINYPENGAPYAEIKFGDRLLVGCGFSIALPEGYLMYIIPRSGNVLRHGLTVANSPGLIDSDYRGEIGVILCNTGTEHIRIHKGDKIAQGVIMQYDVAVFAEVDELEDTERGNGGYGSTDRVRSPVTMY